MTVSLLMEPQSGLPQGHFGYDFEVVTEVPEGFQYDNYLIVDGIQFSVYIRPENGAFMASAALEIWAEDDDNLEKLLDAFDKDGMEGS